MRRSQSNSTNVRNPWQEDTGLVLAFAAGIVLASVALAIMGGVFDRLGEETTVALALFALGYSVLTYLCDRQVRAFIDRGLAQLQGRNLPRARAQLQSAIPPLEVGPRLTRDGQVQPAVRGAARHDVRGAEAAPR